MSVQQIPAGEYAVFEFPFTEIGAVFAYIYGTWLPASGYCQADAPAFERYGEHFNPTDPGSLMEVFVPISKPGHPA
jgi:AraC family transcriptional regulator